MYIYIASDHISILYRTYTTVTCEESDTFAEFTEVVNICNQYDTYSEMYQCTNHNITKETYESANCDGNPTITTVYEDGACDELGVLQEIKECNTDKAYPVQTCIMNILILIVIFISHPCTNCSANNWERF